MAGHVSDHAFAEDASVSVERIRARGKPISASQSLGNLLLISFLKENGDRR